jgi:hypothetical protein
LDDPEHDGWAMNWKTARKEELLARSKKKRLLEERRGWRMFMNQ